MNEQTSIDFESMTLTEISDWMMKEYKYSFRINPLDLEAYRAGMRKGFDPLYLIMLSKCK
jgi:hypothetical protein